MNWDHPFWWWTACAWIACLLVKAAGIIEKPKGWLEALVEFVLNIATYFAIAMLIGGKR